MIRYIHLMTELDGKRPSHRDPSSESPRYISGKEVREQIILPIFKVSDQLVINLTGYNRYSRGFLHEMIAGLIFAENIDPKLVKRKIVVVHDLLPSYSVMCQGFIDDYLEKAD